jgi:hypothetical protein
MTPAGTDEYRRWDAAYVLGSLSPAERHEFEEHLAHCPGCRAAVAELAGLPSLLGALSTEEAVAIAHEEATASLPLPRALAETVGRRRHRARLAVAALVLGTSAASGVVAAAITAPVPPAAQTQASPATILKFTPVAAPGMAATGTITAQPWGTRIDWECSYSPYRPDDPAREGSGEPEPAQEYSLMVVDSRGVGTQVASWKATPGVRATPTATTTMPAAEIRRVEIRAGGSGKTLLSAVL